MVRQKAFDQSPCPVARTLDIIGDKWSMLIIRDLFDGIHRFGEIQKSLNIAKNILTDRLKMLMNEQIIMNVPASDHSNYLEYRLTNKGEALFPVIITLRQWGEMQLFNNDEKHSILVDKITGEPIGKLEIKNKDNKVIKSSDTIVSKIT